MSYDFKQAWANCFVILNRIIGLLMIKSRIDPLLYESMIIKLFDPNLLKQFYFIIFLYLGWGPFNNTLQVMVL